MKTIPLPKEPDRTIFEMKCTILIIEDRADIREWLAEVLELANYLVLKADNGKIGVELAQTHLPDLILCNVSLPEFDGHQVLYLLNMKPETSIIPFIYLIAEAEADNYNVRRGMLLGADDFLVEPFSSMELLNAIECRLRKREKEKYYYSKSFKDAGDFQGDGMEELEEAIKTCKKVKYVKKKQIIYYEGDPLIGVYFIKSGLVKTTKRAEDGRELLINVYGPEEYIGIPAMLIQEPYHVTAQAIEDTSLVLLSSDLVHKLLESSPELNKQFFNILVKDMWEREDQMVQIAYSSVRKRIAEVLLRLLKHKEKELVDISVDLEMSGEDLATMAGVSKETVSRVLGGLTKDGIIEKRGAHIQILDTVRLQEIKN